MESLSLQSGMSLEVKHFNAGICSTSFAQFVRPLALHTGPGAAASHPSPQLQCTPGAGVAPGHTEMSFSSVLLHLELSCSYNKMDLTPV